MGGHDGVWLEVASWEEAEDGAWVGGWECGWVSRRVVVAESVGGHDGVVCVCLCVCGGGSWTSVLRNGASVR